MQSTVANPIDSSVVSGIVAWSLPSGDVTVISTPTIQKKSSNTLLIPHFKEFVGYLIASDVPEIHAVLMRQEDDVLRVYIATKGFDFDVNEKIYDREEHLMSLFGNVDFDFHIIGPRRFGDPALKVVFSR